jgi:hypothetical protein
LRLSAKAKPTQTDTGILIFLLFEWDTLFLVMQEYIFFKCHYFLLIIENNLTAVAASICRWQVDFMLKVSIALNNNNAISL